MKTERETDTHTHTRFFSFFLFLSFFLSFFLPSPLAFFFHPSREERERERVECTFLTFFTFFEGTLFRLHSVHISYFVVGRPLKEQHRKK